MTHDDLTRWADFVRGLGDPANRAVMQQHLESGCADCRDRVEFLRQVVTMTEADAVFDPPEHAVRTVKAIFGLQRPQKVTLPRIMAKLVYDNFLQPHPEGVRGNGRRLTRQVLYHASDYCIDLRMEHESGVASISLVGQISNRRRPTARMPVLPVSLFAGEQVVATATTNQFGEFHMSYLPQRDLRLHLPIGGKGEIEMQVDAAQTGDVTGGEA